jgi:hypothetical protein
MNRTAAVLVLLAVLLLLYALMWRGWRRRGRKHDLPALQPVPERRQPRLAADARYYGSTVAGDWLDRVVARGLGTRSTARLELSAAGLDVVRDAGAFRIPAAALRGARHDQGIAGKVVPPHGLMVVTWAHGGLLLDSGFRLVDGGTTAHEEWVAAVSGLAARADTEEETR